MDNIKLEIFKAVISVGSNNQKENWKATCNDVYRWIEDTEKSPSSKSKKAQKR